MLSPAPARKLVWTWWHPSSRHRAWLCWQWDLVKESGKKCINDTMNSSLLWMIGMTKYPRDHYFAHHCTDDLITNKRWNGSEWFLFGERAERAWVFFFRRESPQLHVLRFLICWHKVIGALKNDSSYMRMYFWILDMWYNESKKENGEHFKLKAYHF